LSAFTKEGLAAEFRQGEILTGLIQYEYNSGTAEAEEQLHPYAIIVHQDCDLLKDHDDRKKNKPPSINGLLLLQLEPLDTIKPKLPGSDILRRIERHGEDRYHMLAPVSADHEKLGLGMPQLVADFRLFFTTPPAEILRQIEIGTLQRRCMLATPYKEHFQSRFGFYLQRVALP
jgi:hypothetical protein